jgi:hypothetical protein
MGSIYEVLSPELQDWLKEQKVFFVSTAPMAREGHINCSPKGGDSLRVLGEREVAYLDLTGSGVETIAHLQENGRILLMFCSFAGAPKILRLHGRGEVIYPDHSRFSALIGLFPEHPAARSIIHVTLTRISDSCGWGVPRMDFSGNRDALDKWSEKQGLQGLRDYRSKKNAASIDGLPGYRAG